MFLTMGLLVFPAQLIPVLPAGLLIAAFLMLVARPVSVFITLAFSRLKINQKLLISWVGLRGSVPIILATFPLLAGIGQSHLIFNLVFFIVVASVLLQGTTTPHLAKLLKVDQPLTAVTACAREHVMISDLDSELIEIEIPEGSKAAGRSLIELGLPEGILVIMQRHENTNSQPGGSTRFAAGDILLVLARRNRVDELCSIFGVEKAGVRKKV